MEVFGSFLDGNGNVHNQLWEHLRAKTFAALDEHALAKSAFIMPEEVRARGNAVREAFLRSIGGLPVTDAPLKVQCRGKVARPGYTIEKLVYESAPRVYVTALFYVPDVAAVAPVPGVLFVSGHGREAKAFLEYQRACQDFVANGFAVLAIDPTGQGERVTHLDPATGEMALEWGTTEHSYQGQQCVLTGTNIARYFLSDALRGIDVLQSRAEVDPERIGVTGNSGGGTQTSLVCMSGDPRVKVAAPCTYVTSRDDYYMTGQPQDAEQLQFGMTANGINFEDFFLPFAPRPLLIGAVSSDFFNPEGTMLTYERLRHQYALFGKTRDVQCVFAPGRHAYARELRTAAVNWFLKHLQGRDGDFGSRGDEEFETLPDSELWCTPRGHVRTEFPEARTPHELNLELAPVRGPISEPERLRESVLDTLAIRERLQNARELFPRTTREQEWRGHEARSVFFVSEPGIFVSGCLIVRQPAPSRECALYLVKDGTRAIEVHEAAILAMMEAGRDVLVLDVRGTGAVAPHPVNAYTDVFPMTFYNTEGWFASSAYCLGESLLGMRVFDVIRAARYLREHCGYERLALYAEGLAPSLWGYLAAALEPSFASAVLDGLVESFEAIARAPLYRRDFVPSLLLHGVLQHWDLPELKVLFEGRELRVAYGPAEAM